jgi:hypothetical protein
MEIYNVELLLWGDRGTYQAVGLTAEGVYGKIAEYVAEFQGGAE